MNQRICETDWELDNWQISKCCCQWGLITEQQIPSRFGTQPCFILGFLSTIWKVTWNGHWQRAQMTRFWWQGGWWGSHARVWWQLRACLRHVPAANAPRSLEGGRVWIVLYQQDRPHVAELLKGWRSSWVRSSVQTPLLACWQTGARAAWEWARREGSK